MVDQNRGYGVGFQLLKSSSFDQREVDVVLTLLGRRGRHFGNGVVAVDCGANVGVHTVEWARSMSGWGEVFSFEPQEKIFYALAGNVIINNCLNVTAKNCAVGSRCATLDIPEPNYLIPSSLGKIKKMLMGYGFKTYPMGLNLLAVHVSDPMLKDIKFKNNSVRLG